MAWSRQSAALVILFASLGGCSAGVSTGATAGAGDASVDSAIPTFDAATPPPHDGGSTADATSPVHLDAGPGDAASRPDGASSPADGASETGHEAGTTSCEPIGSPGPLNDAGTAILPTGTYTWWSFATSALTSLEWSVNIDRRTGDQGYFWSHEFYFADGGGGGYVGIQDNGDYQASPDAASVTTQMVLFSVAGGAQQAVLGDIQPPYGEVSPGFDGTVPDAFSIHVEYPWSVCVPYEFRLWVDSTTAQGDFWLAASITDPTVGVTSVIGKILISQGVGGITPGTVNWTEHWQTNDGTPMSSCSAQVHASAVFTYPIANGSLPPSSRSDDFGTLSCPNARFTVLDAGIRQEMGVGGP